MLNNPNNKERCLKCEKLGNPYIVRKQIFGNSYKCTCGSIWQKSTPPVEKEENHECSNDCNICGNYTPEEVKEFTPQSNTMAEDPLPDINKVKCACGLSYAMLDHCCYSWVEEFNRQFSYMFRGMIGLLHKEAIKSYIQKTRYQVSQENYVKGQKEARCHYYEKVKEDTRKETIREMKEKIDDYILNVINKSSFTYETLVAKQNTAQDIINLLSKDIEQ